MFPMSSLRGAALLVAMTALLSTRPTSVLGQGPLCTTATDGSRSFTSALTPAVYEPGKSGSFSSTSIRQAFFMLGTGAGPQDADEIRLGLRACSPDPFADLASPVVALQKSSSDFNLTIANAMFVDQSFPVKPEFSQTLEDSFGAQSVEVDFVNEPTAAKDTINDFVANKTQGIIPSILDSDPEPDTVMFLVNALYFGAKWKTAFDLAWQPIKFVDAARGVAKEVDGMMKSSLPLAYVNGGTYTAVTVPYREDGYEMLLVRPSGCVVPLPLPNGTDDVVADLGGTVGACLDNTLADAMNRTGAAQRINVKITLPLFHVQWRSESELKDALVDLGVEKVFSPQEADLSGISDAQIYVSKLVHQADVKVTEEGTQAAAATAMGISLTSMPPQPQAEFVLDVPFFYAIVHRPTQTMLFSGWVNDDALEVTGDAEFVAEEVGICTSVGPCGAGGPGAVGDVGGGSVGGPSVQPPPGSSGSEILMGDNGQDGNAETLMDKTQNGDAGLETNMDNEEVQNVVETMSVESSPASALRGVGFGPILLAAVLATIGKLLL